MVSSLHTPADLERAFIEWNGLLYRYAYSRLRNREDAEDVVQHSFEKAWKNRHSFDEEKGSLKTWLFAIVSNRIRDEYRSRKRHPQDELHEDIASSQDIDEQIRQKDSAEWVFTVLEQLSEKDQELIFLRYREDLELADIAELMQMSYEATKVALHRATKRLKELCSECDL